jgi:hypothetical protein
MNLHESLMKVSTECGKALQVICLKLMTKVSGGSAQQGFWSRPGGRLPSSGNRDEQEI